VELAGGRCVEQETRAIIRVRDRAPALAEDPGPSRPGSFNSNAASFASIEPPAHLLQRHDEELGAKCRAIASFEARSLRSLAYQDDAFGGSLAVLAAFAG